MSKPINSLGLFILSLFFLGVSVISCTPSTQNAAATQPSTSDAAILESTPFATSYLTLTPFVTGSAPSADLTQLANDGYIFPSAIEDPIIAEVIQLALTDRIGIAPHGGEPFCSYALLMPLQTDTDRTIKAYVWVFCQEFYERNGSLQRGTGSSVAVALTLEERIEGWSVEFQRPISGNQYWTGIQEIFPTQTWDLIQRKTVVGILLQNTVQAAEDREQHLLIPASPYNIQPSPTAQTSSHNQYPIGYTSASRQAIFPT